MIEGGSRTYVAKMAERFRDRVRLSAPDERVRRSVDGVFITPQNGTLETFDHVVFACHSDQALRMLADSTAIGRNTAVLHTDEAVLPKRRRVWASWNYHLTGESSQHASQAATVSYQMNLLQHLQSKHFFNVTLNSDMRIDPAKVLRRFEYHHPIFTVRRAAAQARHRELINVNRTSFCGAYWGNGFHEDGVVSALRDCEALMPKESRAGKVTLLFDADNAGDEGAKEAAWQFLQRGLDVRLGWSQEMHAGVFKGRQPEGLKSDEWESLRSQFTHR